MIIFNSIVDRDNRKFSKNINFNNRSVSYFIKQIIRYLIRISYIIRSFKSFGRYSV